MVNIISKGGSSYYYQFVEGCKPTIASFKFNSEIQIGKPRGYVLGKQSGDRMLRPDQNIYSIETVQTHIETHCKHCFFKLLLI